MLSSLLQPRTFRDGRPAPRPGFPIALLLGGFVSQAACGGRSELPAPWGPALANTSTSSSTGGGGHGTGGGGEGGALPAGCIDGLPGPRLVEIENCCGGTYCIDATEVTNAHYADWLATNPSTEGQHAECDWNGSFLPFDDWPPTADRLDHPVTWVDWCDALAYCRAAGKRLCGALDGGNAYDEWSDPARSEWMNACTAGGEQSWPYGDTYNPTACNSDEANVGGTVPVGSATSCEGGFPGLFDLVGNVYEWVNACTVYGTAYSCLFQGGSFYLASPAACDTAAFGGNAVVGSMIGFRCCRDGI